MELAELAKRAGEQVGLEVAIDHFPNPRVELEEHYYNAVNTKLRDLGLKPHHLGEELVQLDALDDRALQGPRGGAGDRPEDALEAGRAGRRADVRRRPRRGAPALSAVLFDLDGVLIDSRRAIAGSMNRALAATGLPERPLEELHALIGPPTAVSFSGLLGVAQDDPAVGELVGTYRGFYSESAIAETTLQPGIAEVVAELAGRRRLGVATSKAKQLAEPILEALGLREHFEIVAGPDINDLHEDKAATATRALAELGVETAPLVGDTRFDVVAAVALGLKPIGVTWGIGTEAELREAGAEVIVDEPRELLELL